MAGSKGFDPETEAYLEKQKWSLRVGGAFMDARIHLAKAETYFETGEYESAAKCIERVMRAARILLEAAKEAAGGRSEERG